MEKKINYLTKLLLILVSTNFFVGCNLLSTNLSGTSTININLNSSRSIDTSISNYKLTITGSDFEDIVEESSNGSFSIEVPNGQNRTFTLELFNSDKSLTLYKGSIIADLSGGDISLPINVNKNYVSVSYNLNGGISNNIITSRYYNKGEAINLLDSSNISKLGFTLANWNNKADGSGLYTYQLGESIILSDTDVELYAQWSNSLYSVTYDINGGSSGTVPVDSGTYITGENATVLSGANIFHPSLYFSGWNTKADYSGTSYSSGQNLPIINSNITLYAVWSTFTSATFTTAGVTGGYGPTTAQINNEYIGTILEGQVTSPTTDDGYQMWTVPVTGTYKIDVFGAQASLNYNSIQGAKGAILSGEFTLTAGDVLILLVGQQGSTSGSSTTSSAGGGGTFVTRVDSNSTYTLATSSHKVTPLIIAGGGGGLGGSGTALGVSGSSLESGTFDGGGYGTPGTSGYGGLSGSTDNTSGGGGGAGFIGDGTTKQGNSGYPGTSFLNGGSGGLSRDGDSRGGFGGGGGNHNTAGGGGAGGGYSGGSGGQYYSSTYYGGGGGGSYNSGTNQINTTGGNSGNGKVIITLVQ